MGFERNAGVAFSVLRAPLVAVMQLSSKWRASHHHYAVKTGIDHGM